MHKLLSRLSLIALAGACMPLTGCMDDNYDLSDIDTTVEVTVTDLVVPVNLDEITLSNVFDLDEGSVLKEMNGIYAVLVDGEFKSEAITINAVSLAKPYISPMTTQINLLSNLNLPNINIPTLNIGEQAFTYEVPDFHTPFNYESSSVDKSIRGLSKIAVNWGLELRLSVQNAGNVFKSISFRNLKLNIPAGLKIEGMNNNNGVIALPDIDLSAGNMSHIVSLNITEIDFTKLSPSEFTFTPDPTGENNGRLMLNGNIGLASGYVVAVTNPSISNVPSYTQLTLAPEGTAISITSVDGSIRYGVDNFNVDPVTLNDLPDLLQQDGTNIIMANPRLYLSINNPLAGYKLDASSGLTLTACRENSRENYSLNPGQTINIGSNKGIDGPYKFCLAPDPDNAKDFAGFEDAQPVGYTGLGQVLSGNGLPSTIEVSFDDPHVGPGAVQGFTLPQTLNAIKGSYHFYAPLNLGVGSQIIYEESTDGWNDDTVDRITVEHLKVSATVKNSLPFDIVLTGYPIDINGNQCRTADGKLVNLGNVTVKAGGTSQFELENDGTITHIDGVHYSAKATVTEAGITLRPDATITLSNIKATVSGHYYDEL